MLLDKLLEQIIQKMGSEKKTISELKINRTTLSRWRNYKTNPNSNSLMKVYHLSKKLDIKVDFGELFKNFLVE